MLTAGCWTNVRLGTLSDIEALWCENLSTYRYKAVLKNHDKEYI